MPHPPSISLERADLTADTSRQLIAALNAELSGAYSEPGAKKLVLETGTRQTAALALYRGTGFVSIPLYGEYCLSPDTSICLGKELVG